MVPDLSGVATWSLALAAGATVLMVLVIAAVRLATTTRRKHRARRREAALPLLIQITDGDAVPPPRDRRTAQSLGQAAAEMVHKIRGADRQALADWLASNGYRDLALEGMSSRWPPHRARAIELYLAVSSGTEPAPVVAMLRDRHPGVRTAAVRALGWSTAEVAVPALVAAVEARRHSISVSAAAMAIVHSAPRTSTSLEAAWRSHDPRVRQLAVDIAGHLELADARVELEIALGSTWPTLRVHAAHALEAIGTPVSVGALADALLRAEPASAEAMTMNQALAVLVDGLYLHDTTHP